MSSNLKRIALVGLLSTSICATASAAEQVQVDVCRDVIEKLFVPPTFKEVFSCPMDARCFFLPHCCVPVLCATDPVCRMSELVVDVAGHWVENHKLVCEPEWKDPGTELKKWLQGQIPNLEDVLLPGARQVVAGEIQLMRTQGQRIPDPVKAVIRELLQSYWSGGTAKFDQQDIDNVRIISSSNALAAPYLQSGFDAITLTDVIIVDKATFPTLTAAFPTLATLRGDQTGRAAQISAALLLVHELVHAKQYRELGFSVFLDQYLFEALQHGYSSISFEQLAYDFGEKVRREQFTNYTGSSSSSSSSLTATQTNEAMRACLLSKKATALDQIKVYAKPCWEQIVAKYQVPKPKKVLDRRFVQDAANNRIEVIQLAPKTIEAPARLRAAGSKGTLVPAAPVAPVAPKRIVR
jgi:hypothetical protein